MNNGKITILCAMENARVAQEFMHAVGYELNLRGVTNLRVNTRFLTLSTKHTQTSFMYDPRRQPLDGVRADALFGLEPFKLAYKNWLVVGAPYDTGMGLVDYICHIENEAAWFPDGVFTCKKSDEDLASEIKKVVHEEARKAVTFEIMKFGVNKNKTTLTPEAVREVFKKATDNGVLKPKEDMYKLDAASVYPGRFEIKASPAVENAITEMWYKEQAKLYNYILHDCFVAKEASKDMGGIRFNLPEIKNVIFNDPATIVIWADGTKTVVQCQEGDIYDPEKGLAMAISKKIMGNKRDYYHTFKHWLKRYKPQTADEALLAQIVELRDKLEKESAVLYPDKEDK